MNHGVAQDVVEELQNDVCHDEGEEVGGAYDEIHDADVAEE